MYQPQRGVTIPDFRHKNTNCTDIVHLRKTDALTLHLSPNAVDMLRAAGDFELKVGLGQYLAEVFPNAIDEPVALPALTI